MTIQSFGDAPAESVGRVETVGTWRTGFADKRGPQSCEAWRLTTESETIAKAIAERFGGEVTTWQSSRGDDHQVFTTTTQLDIILAGPEAIRTQMLKWGGGTLVRSCDGISQRDGAPCACPGTLVERKAAARDGSGCEPSTRLIFKLVGLEQLGDFSFTKAGAGNTAWRFAQSATKHEAQLAEIGGPALATLVMFEDTFTPKGQLREVSYVNQRLDIIGPVVGAKERKA